MSTETVTAADLAAENLGTSAPTSAAAPLTPTAPSAAPAPAAAAAPAGTPGAAPEVDALGRPFDPAKFSPKKDSRGRWVNKNAGRKPSNPAAASTSGKSYVAPDAPPAGDPAAVPPDAGPPGSAGTAAAAPTIAADRFDLAAEMYCRAGYSVLDGVFSGGGEWLPENDAEHVALRGALATYLRHKKTDDLPPGLALALATATYSAKRFSRPNTLTRLRLFGYWVRARVYAWRTGRALADLPPPTPPAPAADAAAPLPPQNLPPADSSTNPKP